MSSFLKAYLRYGNASLSADEQDRYYAETSRIAHMLGARDVPTNRAEIDAYLNAMRPQLQASERAQEVVRVLMSARLPRTSR